MLAGLIGAVTQYFSKKDVSQTKENISPGAEKAVKTGGGLILNQSKLANYSKAPPARIADTVEHIAKMKP